MSNRNELATKIRRDQFGRFIKGIGCPGFGFKEGQGYWVGKKLTEEHKKKISEGDKGRIAWNKGRKIVIYKCSSCGKEVSKRSTVLCFECNKLRPRKPHPIDVRNKVSIGRRGKCVGMANHNWRGGITDKNRKIRASIEYSLWRESVFARDVWTCQGCQGVGGKLHAHHIKSFSKFPELRFAIDNGLTLCKSCHKETYNYGNKR